MEHIEKLTALLIEKEKELEKYKKLYKKWEDKAFVLQDENNELNMKVKKVKNIVNNSIKLRTSSSN
jgi:septal ring factor EnvC (AmiA/AmiB activator)